MSPAVGYTRGVLADAVRVVQALRAGPRSIGELAASLALAERKVYRLVAQLEAMGAPIVRGEAERTGARGFAPTTLHITVAGLRAWLG